MEEELRQVVRNTDKVKNDRSRPWGERVEAVHVGAAAKMMLAKQLPGAWRKFLDQKSRNRVRVS